MAIASSPKSKYRPLNFLLIAILIITSLLAAPALAAGSYPLTTGDAEIISALSYLQDQQSTDGSIGSFSDSAWVVMAAAAAGEDPHSWQVDANPSLVAYLAANASEASSANDYSRMILAIAAADEDPASFGGVDFISLLQAEHSDSQIGSTSLLNDDFWGVMALIAAGEDPSATIVADGISYILSNQNGDGGWGWGVGQASDVDNTAAAIMALIAAGESASSTAISNALTYIKTTQQDNGGFESWGSTNADTDSWAICSIAAAGQDPTDTAWEDLDTGNDPVDDLLSFQQTGGGDEGSFYWQAGNPGMSLTKTTACAITALLGEPFPVAVLTSEEPDGVEIDVRIEGESDTVWSGTVTVETSPPTALDALDEAAQSGGFSYTTEDFGWGIAITQIDGVGDWDTGPWWLFFVDGASAQVGADAFVLDETSPPSPPHGEVLFAVSSTFTEIPLKAEVDNDEPGIGETFTATISEYDSDTSAWIPAQDATVHADEDYTTDENGEVDIAIDTDLTVEIYAEKDGYIRSNRVTVTVGEGSGANDNQQISLNADIIPAISFSVDLDSANFGTLGPRDTSNPVTLTLTNEGAWHILITATVMDTAQNLYVTGLELDDLYWDDYSETVFRDDNEECVATLTVPETYTLTGQQGGTLIFWAEESP